METLGAATISVDHRLGQAFRLHWRWLTVYVCLLILGVGGDLVWCEFGPVSLFWAQVLPLMHCIGVVFAATRFGIAMGLTSACLAEVLHTAVIITACGQSDWKGGHFAIFVAIALTGGLVGTNRKTDSNESESMTIRAAEEHGRNVSLSELGRMMPELMHQFRTPIASIEGAGFVLEDADLSDDKRQEFVGIIRKECRRLEVLIELLDFTQSRISIDQDIDMAGLLDEIIGLCRPKVEPGIVLRNTSRRDLPRLHCDPKLVRHAVHALVTNATRAISQNGEVELSAELPSGEIVIRVLAHANHLYAPVDPGSNYKPGGIDLKVVEQIISRNGGSVRVEPSPRGDIAVVMILPRESV